MSFFMGTELANILDGLVSLLHLHADKRVVVIGTTCTGKSTLLEKIPFARDMDRELFSQLTKAEADYVCQTPWTPEIGKTMSRLVREKVLARVGSPVFGTVVIDSDLLIVLKISDELLLQRVNNRGASFADAKNMRQQILEEVQNSGIPSIGFNVG